MSLTRSVFWLFVAEFFFYVSGYIVHTGAGRILGPEDYGRYGLVITLVVLIANLIGSGIPIAMSKFISEAAATTPERIFAIKRLSMKAQAIAMGVITAGFFFSAEWIARLLGDPTLAPLLRLSSFIIPCYAADAFYFQFFSGMQRFSIQSALKLFRSILRVVVILGLAALFALPGIVAGYIVVPLFVFFVAWGIDTYLSRSMTVSTVAPEFSLQTLLRLAVPITLFLVLFESLMSFDLYLLKYLSGDDALVGQYNAALTIARIPTFLFYALTIILIPTIAESFSKMDKARTREIVTAALRFVFLVTLPFVALVAAYAEPATLLFFGDRFHQASIFLPWLIAGSGTLSLLYVLSFAYKGAGNIRTPLLFLGVALVLNAVLDVLLFSRLGAEAFPIAKTIVGVAILPFFLFSIARTFDARVKFAEAMKAGIVALVVFSAALFSPDSISGMLIVAPILFVVYFAVLFALGVVTRDDIASFRQKKAV